MKILITGGAGFVGCNLADYFITKGDDVTVFDNLSRKGTENNIDWLKSKHKKISFIKADIRDSEAIKQACNSVDVIFHCAAQVAVTTSVKNPREDFEINALGTLNVLEAARLSSSDPTVIFTSTNKVYGNNVNLIALKEGKESYEFGDPKFSNGVPENLSTDADEHTPYGSSKYAADLYVRDYAAVFGLKSVVFRMSCIYGLRQFGTEDQGWVAHFVISSIFNKPLIIYGDGKQVRDVLFVEDLVKAFEMATENINKTKGKAYNIGGGIKNTISLFELMSILEKLNSKKLTYSFSDWRPSDQKVYISDIRKAKNEFGWEPKISSEEGIKKLHSWIVSNKHLFEHRS